ncbi:MAG: N-formylglutamate amidohydrolase, partial [Rhodothermales bacterium]|nr:N-formylglutamate amidohydrolase [Rhodothermales bacterium]
MDRVWTLEEGEGPVVAVAVHHGHAVRPDVERALAIGPEERLREEDPFTGAWTSVAPTRVVVHRSRFEVDMNRERDDAVYSGSAWGRPVWKGGASAPADVAARSLEEYDAFYAAVGSLLGEVVARHGRAVVLDLHSYNHRREGPGGPEADPAGNPDVNLGTGS